MLPQQDRTDDHSVSRWIATIKTGSETHVGDLWEYLRRRLLRMARNIIEVHRSAVYDEEDIALSAFGALCTAFQHGRYAVVDDRDQLWRLLTTITVNKARNRLIHERRERRGGLTVQIADPGQLMNSLIADETTPELELIMREECGRLLNILNRPEVKRVALLRVEGYTDSEIAQKLGCTRRSVQRRLTLIRELWLDSQDEREQTGSGCDTSGSAGT